jgi:nucleoid-associated protein YgaU
MAMKGTLANGTTLSLASAGAVCAALFAWTIAANHPKNPPVAMVRDNPAAAPERTALEFPTRAPASATVTAAVEALKTLGNPVSSQADRTDHAPAFDLTRIEPNGEAVIAGRAAPGATVELLRGGEVHDRTVATPSGEFVLVPKPLPPGNYDLTLRATKPDGQISTSKDSVAVALRSGSQEKPAVQAKPVVALVAPAKPAAAPSRPATNSAAALTIDVVETTQAGGSLYVSGRSVPGAIIRLYLNDAYIASAIASPEGLVAFAIQSGVKPGDYRVRLDQMDAGGTVGSRAEVPFKAPVRVAASAESPTRGLDTPAGPATAAAAAQLSLPPTNFAPAAGTPPTEPTAGESMHQRAPSETAVAVQATPVFRLAAAPPALPESAPPRTPPGPREDTSTEAAQPMLSLRAAAPEAGSQPAALAVVMPPNPAKSSRQPNVVIVPSVETTLVIRGDNLWRISRTTYGDGLRYSVIFAANRDQIRDPDLIYPGQVFVLPKRMPAAAN